MDQLNHKEVSYGQVCAHMENVFGRFLHNYNANQLVAIGALFLKGSEQVQLTLESEDVHATGRSCICKALEKLEYFRRENASRDISFSATPRYEVTSIPDGDGVLGEMVCDVFTYRCHTQIQTQKAACELSLSQLRGVFLYEDKQLKIKTLNWHVIQNMVPWPFDEKQNNNGILPYKAVDLPSKGAHFSSEVVRIRNLQNSFFERRMQHVTELFTDEATPLLWIEPLMKNAVCGKKNIEVQFENWSNLEKNQNGLYCLLGITGTPVIEVTGDGQCAEGLFLVQLFQAVQNHPSHTHENSEGLKPVEIIRHMCHLHGTYQMVQEEWKIVKLEITSILELPNVLYEKNKRYDRMSGMPHQWVPVNDKMPGNFISDTYQIESIFNAWTYHCRFGALEKFYETYMKNEEVACCIRIRSQGMKSKDSKTDPEIVERLSGMDRQHHQLMYSYHTATTPIIEIDKQGTLAKATWFDHSATNLLSQATTIEKIPYMSFVSKYQHEFRKIKGKWFLVDFYSEPLIGLPDWEYNARMSKGFVAKEQAKELPNPFILEKIRRCCVESTKICH